MHIVQKAGAVVLSKNNPEKILVLYQKKHDDFSFPKGHLESNETLQECAIRETKEETGLDIEILRPLNVTAYTNKTDGNVELTFFLAQSSNDDAVNPETGCQIYWLNYDEAMQKLSYKNLQEVLKALKEKA